MNVESDLIKLLIEFDKSDQLSVETLHWRERERERERVCRGSRPEH